MQSGTVSSETTRLPFPSAATAVRTSASSERRSRSSSSRLASDAAVGDNVLTINSSDIGNLAVGDDVIVEDNKIASDYLGTGTGRLLQVMSPRVDHAMGVDASKAMLALARALQWSGGGGARP